MRPNHLPDRRLIAAIALAVAAGPARAGDMLFSNRDRSLAINAWGGAGPNVPLRLHNGCRPDNRDCLWTYRGGLLQSDSNLGLSVRAENVSHGAALKLVTGCHRELRECTWTYRDGMFVSDADPSLAINAWGGARYGTTLRLSRDCRPNNPDCTWSR